MVLKVVSNLVDMTSNDLLISRSSRWPFTNQSGRHAHIPSTQYWNATRQERGSCHIQNPRRWCGKETQFALRSTQQ